MKGLGLTEGTREGQIDFCIKGQKFPRVTRGKELCKPYLEEGFMQNMPPVTHGEE